MVDITTGTGDFIANGVISHNCFARGTHEYLDLDAGRDFDTQIVVKINVADVLQKELRRGTWQRDPVMLGTNTDPYQRAEGRYRLMPDIVGALTESGTPFSILTKGTLLRRDLPLLQDAAASVRVSLAMSIAVFDDALQHSVEPGTPSAAARLETVRAATEAGFRVTVFLMPILPHLTDSIPAIDDALTRIKDAGARPRRLRRAAPAAGREAVVHAVAAAASIRSSSRRISGCIRVRPRRRRRRTARGSRSACGRSCACTVSTATPRTTTSRPRSAAVPGLAARSRVVTTLERARRRAAAACGERRRSPRDSVPHRCLPRRAAALMRAQCAAWLDSSSRRCRSPATSHR